MKIQSLGYQTDFFVHSFENRVTDRGDYMVLETLGNPTFFWGNLVLFSLPPKPGDLPRWTEIFAREFAHQPLVKHVTLAWDSPDAVQGASAEFVQAGFKLEESVVLSTKEVHAPPKWNTEVRVRPLASSEEWELATLNQIATRDSHHSLELFEPFKRAQMLRYKRMVDAGLGLWYGAFLGSTLVADLGVYAQDGLGRYQNVGTNPDFRRQGICGTLVWQAALHAQEHLGAKKLVMVADENYHAARIYESVGFLPTQRQAGLCREPKEWKAT